MVARPTEPEMPQTTRLDSADASEPYESGTGPSRPDSGLVGRVLGGRYRILREMARGGLGRVYEARHVELERRVAIKVLSEEVARNAEAIKRFQREAQTASQIGHPNIIDVHDLGRTDQGAPFLAMELLDGEDLDDHLGRSERLAPERVIELLRPVASALDAVHARGIVHRDVKPANIFLAERVDGSVEVKLLDFGLAAFQENSDRLTQLGSVVGTPHYMPPEAAEGELSGPQGDVYSLAAVAYECLCGKLPFDAEQSTGVLVKKVARAAPRMSERTGEAFPTEVEDELARALDRNPEMRHDTCLALIDALEAAIEAGDWAGAAAAGPSPAAPSASPDIVESGAYERVPTHKPVGLTMGVALVALLAVGGATWALTRGADGAADDQPESAAQDTADDTAEDSAETEQTVEATAPDDPALEETTDETAETDGPEQQAQATRPARRSPTRGRRGPRPATVETAPETQPEPRETQPRAEEPPAADTARATQLARQAGSELIRGQVAAASRHARQATMADPAHAPGWRVLGMAEQELGRNPEAARAYRRYLALDGTSPAAGQVRQRLGQLE